MQKKHKSPKLLQKIQFLPKKWNFCTVQERQKVSKSLFSHKPMILQLLAKHKQKTAKKSLKRHKKCQKRAWDRATQFALLMTIFLHLGQ